MPSVIQDQGILCISSIDWDFIWQGHQQIMSTLAANRNKVLFIENTGVRRVMLRDTPRLLSRLRNWWHGTKGFRVESENLVVYSPLVLPFPYSRIARWINRWIVSRALRRWMDAAGVHHPIIWTFLPTPLVLDLIQTLEPELVIYYCIDDFQSSSPGAAAIRKTEHRLFREADLVFVTSDRLRERVCPFRHQVHVFPFAVDFRRFEAVRKSTDGIPPDLAAIRRPVAGYIGGLHGQLDQNLVAATARRLPEISFVFIGPTQCDVSILASEPTVQILGPRLHDQLPGYIKGFDVGIIPYASTEYTANVYPTKLNEYLAMGIPVVSTGIPEIHRFNEKHGKVIAIADNDEDFASELGAAVRQSGGAAVERRIAVAQENSWDARIEAMTALISEVLTAKRLNPIQWEKRLRRLYRAARARLITATLIVLDLYLLIFYTPLIWAIARPLRIVDPASSADAIVVFAGGVGESGMAGGGYQERVKHAVELYKAGLAKELVFSSGFVFAFREGEIMRNLAVDLGIPSAAIRLEERAASTMQNVVNVRDIVRRGRAKRILLVSSPYHMRRAVLTWRKQAPEIAVIASPVAQSQYYDHTYGATVEQIRGIAWEYAALIAYWWHGWL